MYDKRDDSRIGSGNDIYQSASLAKARSGQDDSYSESLDDTKFGVSDFVEPIEICGEYINETITSKHKIKLLVQGNDNTVTVDPKTVVASVSIYGRRNTIRLPKSFQARIDNNGIECEIEYF